MTVTIITNHCGDGETFVQAVRGGLSDEQKMELSRLVFAAPKSDRQDASETLSFAVVEVCDDLSQVAGRLAAADRSGFISTDEPEKLHAW